MADGHPTPTPFSRKISTCSGLTSLEAPITRHPPSHRLARHRRPPSHEDGIRCCHHPSSRRFLIACDPFTLVMHEREHVQSTLFNLHTPWPPQGGLQYPPKTPFLSRPPYGASHLCRPRPSCSRLAPPQANKLQNGQKGTAPGPRPTSERVLELLTRVYTVEGRLSAPKPAGLTTATGSGLVKPFSALEGHASSSEPCTSLASPLSNSGLIAAKGEVVKREESQNQG